MGTEITRASNADRDLVADHIPELFTQGYITEERMYHMLDLVLKAETLHQLDDILEGLPRPETPPRPRDYAIPRNFLPACAAWSLFGATLATAPAVALSGVHNALAATVSALCILWGIWIVIVSVVTACIKGVGWDDLTEREKEERRRKDQEDR